MSFLDPYGGRRRVPLVWIARGALLVATVALVLLVRWLWGLVAG